MICVFEFGDALSMVNRCHHCAAVRAPGTGPSRESTFLASLTLAHLSLLFFLCLFCCAALSVLWCGQMSLLLLVADPGDDCDSLCGFSVASTSLDFRCFLRVFSGCVDVT